jgi:zinc transporter, ZIP family
MNSHNLIIMAIPALVALGGGVLASYWNPSHQMRSLIQHFAAGVVLAALAVELLPEIGREHAPGLVLVGSFALGSLFMYGLKMWTMRLEHQATISNTAAGLGTGLLLATFIDVATDGFIIGAGFAAGGETGTILALVCRLNFWSSVWPWPPKRQKVGASSPFPAHWAARC